MTDNQAILVEIKSLKEFFTEKFKDARNEQVARFEEAKEDRCQMKESLAKIDGRVRVLEDWRLVFVAKYTTYSAVALFLGSIISTIAYQFLAKYI